MEEDQIEPKGTGSDGGVRQMPSDFGRVLGQEIEAAGGEMEEAEEYRGSIGRTMFDTPSSKDNTITVLLPAEAIGKVPSQSLVRIRSRSKESGGDERQYLGAVVQGPFAEPDGLKADAPIVVTTTVRGAMFMPRYHGRIQVGILGEEAGKSLVPPRFRPLPNSPVFTIDDEETHSLLGLDGDIEIGRAVGFQDMAISIPSKRKSVLPRHLGVIGTTGGGKSTTVSGLIHQFQAAGIATIVVDTEGEYTEVNQPTSDELMVGLLAEQARLPSGVSNLQVFHLVGRETTASAPTPVHSFKVDFSSLSPYAAAEIMGLSDAQLDRFFKAYDATKLVLRDLGLFPAKGNAAEERQALEVDEFEVGYPKITLSKLIDVAGFFLQHLSHGEFDPFNPEFKTEQAKAKIIQRVAKIDTSSEISWKALLNRLWRLHRLGIFDNPRAAEIPFKNLSLPGQTTVIDLSDTQSPQINNLVIAHLLRGVQQQQEVLYQEVEEAKREPTPTMIIIEEAHEFLSRDKIARMQNLFEQVARIARRGRKRWLGLMFVTQLPQHLPEEVLGLINNYILHKITDANVITRLKRSIGGIDESLWDKVPNLSPGQALVSMSSMTRPLLATINPTPCRLRMTE